MTITLQPEQQRAVEEAIRGGAFRSVDEFIETAVATLPNYTIAADLPHTPPRTSRLWELREGLALDGLSIKELIEDGRE